MRRFVPLLTAVVGFGLLISTSVWGQVVSPQPDSTSTIRNMFSGVNPLYRPWVYWFWLNGNLSREGIEADLQAMQEAGIGGVLIMEVDQGTPPGSVRFGSQEWQELFYFMLAQAAKRQIRVNMNNDAGWTGSGGPWIKPEQAMQRIVWSEVTVDGPRTGEIALPQPPVVENYYRDVAVLAFPRPSNPARIDGIAYKSLAQVPGGTLVVPGEVPEPPAEQVISPEKIVDLTGKMDAGGRLQWNVPEGKWTLLRFGHTPTGARNHPSPEEGRGLECDKLSPEGADAAFEGLIGRLLKNRPENLPSAARIIRTHIDSWEVGSQNWTPRTPEEFARRRGYDLRPYLPVIAGYVVGSREISERFLWDFRQTIGELVLDNYAGRFRSLARKNGLSLTIEAYTSCPVDELAYAGRADEPMGEFWSWSKYGAAFSCTEMASAAHVYGMKVVGAEAFTATDAERWLGHPGNIKELGDWAFCEGINRFVFHRYAMQPWTNPPRMPGISMGPWGLHYERTQTWWSFVRPWHEYLTRCQYLLQQGLFVADFCLLTPEAVPQTLAGQNAITRFGQPRERGPFNYDFCPPEVVLTRMNVQDGRLVLPDGMNYAVLVLPRVERMTLPLVQKIAQFIKQGATVIGGPPTKTPGLGGYPDADAELRKLVEEVWGAAKPPAEITVRNYGSGRVIFGGPFSPAGAASENPGFALAQWVWTTEGNPTSAVPVGHRYFRRVFELPADAKVSSAWLVITADNEFECKVNGRRVGRGDDFHRPYRINVTGHLRPGKNLLAVDAFNAADFPNPAGLIAALHLRFENGQQATIVTDKQWEWSASPPPAWESDPAAPGDWKVVQEVGPLGIAPWGDVSDVGTDPNLIPDLDEVFALAPKLGLIPDFRYETTSGEEALRYIHRRIDDIDVYFVANKTDHPVHASCFFRVKGKRPELWYPETGKTVELVAPYRTTEEGTELALNLEGYESVFVVFTPNPPVPEYIVSILHEGREVLWPKQQQGTILIRKALYGVLDDPQRTRDVTEKIQRWVNEGRLRFQVAELARDDDPAYLIVKRLIVDYEVDGQPGHIEATDPQTIQFPRAAVREPTVKLLPITVGRCELGVSQPGKYTIKTSRGREISLTIPQLPPCPSLSGKWELRFFPGSPQSKSITLEKLISWTEFPEPEYRYYSGRAVYSTEIYVESVPRSPARENWSVELDLGEVQVAAQVSVNGKPVGILWHPPYRINIGKHLAPGANTLEIEVANLWINRMIGDEQLPEDSERNPNGTLKRWPDWLLRGEPSPTGRQTFTTWRLWKKDDPLQPSGLLGPVQIRQWVPVLISLEYQRPEERQLFE